MITARETALNVLQALETGKKRSDQILHRTLEQSALNRIDRALATGLVNGVLRYRLQLDFIISRYYHHKLEKAAPVLKNILRLGVYQILFLDKVPDWAAVNECVKLARKYKGDRMSKLVNGVLRKITPQSITLDEWLKEKEPAEQLAIKHSHPRWLVERWIADYGLKKTEALLTYNNRFPLFGFRINRLKTSEEQLFSDPLFSSAAYDACSIENLFISKEFSSFEPAVSDGRLTVQNPTQALACLLLNPVPGSAVLDLCAAPGGKSTFMAELMENNGSVTSLDLYAQKLLKITTHAEALGITIITTVAADARSFKPENRPDAILLDAPCSGTGVVGRRTELRWKLTPENIQELITLQKELLDHAAELLEKNGVLVYATCSIEPEENGLQIEAFLQRHPDFSVDPDSGKVPEPFLPKSGFKGAILTLPGEYPGFDGGFAQRLRKTGKQA
ncbi:16S rRNA (cytosine(967)-C(5))-methyltransferase [Chlorobium sp. BLA1]|uniref:16S rRNA (cytosine(967)-C(5))-methyltransferase RsmB n=1 Tax=Candidatus Chlorobium masyuteum TaxID=2716876 RepID=UPI001420F577|nr:16S rRNA (cytosine(967)-C(5))-methyltransferase RsmB [Candidatus Chlorobium masyuteum]NHQ60642.1 16S rRNA (cytosine(967)-C(5))-methyltransferase [Candidatus Chlorobium masyuteum]